MKISGKVGYGKNGRKYIEIYMNEEEIGRLKGIENDLCSGCGDCVVDVWYIVVDEFLDEVCRVMGKCVYDVMLLGEVKEV